MPGVPIPDDWDELADGYAIGIVCVPNSVLWRAVVNGAIYNISRGWFWDETTGTITDVQAIAKEIWEGFCMTACEDLVIALQGANNTELTKSVKELTSALVGLNRNIADPLPDTVDYSLDGLGPILTLIRSVLEDFVDDVDELEEIQQEVARALAGVVIPVVTP